ncbi:hypothetical protein Q3C01_08410 [Bradyrhizobium sp. UFLA05-109]
MWILLDQLDYFAALRGRKFDEHPQQSQTLDGLARHRSSLLGPKKFGKAGIGHSGSFKMETTMRQQTNIEQLCRRLDEAIICAEEAGLSFVVMILDMARLEVDQSARSNVITMPTSRTLDKRP